MSKFWLIIGLGWAVAASGVEQGALLASKSVTQLERPQALPTARPEDVGMSSQRLRRIATAMQRHIDSGRIQGAITAVARRGKVVHFETHGLMDVDNDRAMEADAIFRMASSTKPILGVATLMLVEEGLLRPRDPVSKYIPEFKNLKVIEDN